MRSTRALLAVTALAASVVACSDGPGNVPTAPAVPPPLFASASTPPWQQPGPVYLPNPALPWLISSEVAVDGPTLVWGERNSSDKSARLQLYDRATGTTSTLWTEARPGQTLSIHDVAVSSTWVLWNLRISDGTSVAWELYAYNRISGQTYTQSTGFIFRINVSGGRAVFAQPSSAGADIILWDLDNGGTVTVLASVPATGGFFCCADIDGDLVIYTTSSPNAVPTPQAYLLNLNGGPPEVLPFSPNVIFAPRISGNRIAYATGSPGTNEGVDLYLYDISSRTSTLVVNLGWNLTGWFSFDLSEDIIAWTADADEHTGDVFSLVYANLTQLDPTQADVFLAVARDLEVSALSIASSLGGPTINGPFGLTVYQAPYLGPPGDPGRPFPKKPK